MPFSKIVQPEQLAIVTAVFDDICAVAGVDADGPERDDVASLVMRLYWEGHRTPGELRAAVAARLTWEASAEPLQSGG